MQLGSNHGAAAGTIVLAVVFMGFLREIFDLILRGFGVDWEATGAGFE